MQAKLTAIADLLNKREVPAVELTARLPREKAAVAELAAAEQVEVRRDPRQPNKVYFIFPGAK